MNRSLLRSALLLRLAAAASAQAVTRVPRNSSRLKLFALLIGSFWILACPPASYGGGGGENLLMLVNPTNEASLRIANAYAKLRAVPDNNIVYFTPSTMAGYQLFGCDYASSFLPTFVNGLSATISSRGLGNQIDYIATFGLPQTVSGTYYTSSGVKCNTFLSFTYALGLLTEFQRGMTGGQTLGSSSPGKDPTDIGAYYRTSELCQVNVPWFSDTSGTNVGAAPDLPYTRGNNSAIRHSTSYTPVDVTPPGYNYIQWYLAGNTGNSGMFAISTSQVIANLQYTAAGDGTKPAGRYYFENSGDTTRTGTRAPYWGSVEKYMNAQSIPWLQEDSLYQGTPHNRTDVRGVSAGAAGLTLPNGSIWLPGSYADNMTSNGGCYGANAQIKSDKMLQTGAGCTAGTCTEPYATQTRFTFATTFIFSAEGSTLGEAHYQAIQDPDVDLLEGDLLSQAYADVPHVVFTSAPADYATVSGTLSLTTSAALVPPLTTTATSVSYLELFVDGLSKGTKSGASGTFSLSTTTLTDGIHEIRAVAYNNSKALSQGYVLSHLVVNNQGRSIVAATPSYEIAWNQTLPVPLTVTPGTGTVSSLRLLCLGRTVASLTGSSGSPSLTSSNLAFGDNVIVPVAVFTDSSLVQGKPVTVTRDFLQPSGVSLTPSSQRTPGFYYEYFGNCAGKTIATSSYGGTPTIAQTGTILSIAPATPLNMPDAFRYSMSNTNAGLAVRATTRMLVVTPGEYSFWFITTWSDWDSFQLSVDGFPVMGHEFWNGTTFNPVFSWNGMCDTTHTVYLPAGEHVLQVLLAEYQGTGSDGAAGFTLWYRGPDGVSQQPGVVQQTTSAQFYTVSSSSYSVTAVASPTVGGSAVVTNSQALYPFGTPVQIVATPASGYQFANWSLSGSGSILNASAATTTLTVDGNDTVTANFTQIQYSGTETYIVADGSINLSNSGPYTYGQVITATANANAGFSFAGWSITGPSTLSNSTTMTTSVTVYASFNLTANFNAITYGLSGVASPVAGGTVSPISTTGTIGQVIAISATTNSGYAFNNWTATGGATITNPTAPSTTLTLGANNCIVTANFSSLGAATRVPLNLSGGFNMNAMIGPVVGSQATLAGSNAVTWLGQESQGFTYVFPGLNQNELVCDSSSNDGLTGTTYKYFCTGLGGFSGTGTLTGSQGLPENGIVNSAVDSRTYLIASVSGNALLPGDWTEPPYLGINPNTYTASNNRFNSIWVGQTGNSYGNAYKPFVTASFQPGYYSDLNMLLAGEYETTKGCAYTQIWATYANVVNGSNSLKLYDWGAYTDSRNSYPIITQSVAPANFKLAYTVGAAGRNGVGSKSVQIAWGIGFKEYLWEFTTPLTIDSTRVLVSITVSTTRGGGNYNNAIEVFGSTATASATASNTLTVQQTTGGFVSTSQSGITQILTGYPYGAQVVLTATATGGYSFSSWNVVPSANGSIAGTGSQAVLTIYGNVAVSANFTSSGGGTGTYVPLDLSGGFNMNAMIGPVVASQATLAGSNAVTWLGQEAQGFTYVFPGTNQNELVCDSSSNDGMSGTTYKYFCTGLGGFSGTGTLTGSQGLPENGIISSVVDSRSYLIASVSGNTLLPGDWTEPPYLGINPNTYTASNNKFNAIWVGQTGNGYGNAYTPFVTASVQPGNYTDVNLLLAGEYEVTKGCAYTQIWATYSNVVNGSNSLKLYDWGAYTDSRNSYPIITQSVAPANFTLAYTVGSSGRNGSGSKSVQIAWGTGWKEYLWEFTTPLTLDSNRVLVSITISSTRGGGNNNNAIIVFGATATTANGDRMILKHGLRGMAKATPNFSSGGGAYTLALNVGPQGVATATPSQASYNFGDTVKITMSTITAGNVLDHWVLNGPGILTNSGALTATLAVEGQDTISAVYTSGSYVNNLSPYASDANVGSLQAPFKTVTKALTKAQGGQAQSIVIQQGLYRESPAATIPGTGGNPITLRSNPGDRVVITGADVIPQVPNTWTLCTSTTASGNPNYAHIYYTDVTWSGCLTQDSTPFCFSEDEQPLLLAQTPSNGPPSYWAITGAAGAGTLIDTTNLTQSDSTYWLGANLFYLAPYSEYGTAYNATLTITAYDPATSTLTFTPSRFGVTPGFGYYFLYGSPKLLGGPGQWAVEALSGSTQQFRVWVWPTDNGRPDGHLYQATRRDQRGSGDGSEVEALHE